MSSCRRSMRQWRGLLTASAMDAHNTFAQPSALVPQPYSAGANRAALALELPPKSVVVVSVMQ